MKNKIFNITVLAANISKLMAIQELTESELARRTNISQPQLHRLRNKKIESPCIETLMQLANYFTISIEQLVGKYPIPYEHTFAHTNSHFGWSMAPLITWDKIESFLNNKENFEHILKQVPTDIYVEENDLIFALKMNGSYMEPQILPESILIFKTDDKLNDGNLCLIKFSDETSPVLREIFFDGNTYFASCISNKINGFKEIYKNKDKVLAILQQSRYDFENPMDLQLKRKLTKPLELVK